MFVFVFLFWFGFFALGRESLGRKAGRGEVRTAQVQKSALRQERAERGKDCDQIALGILNSIILGLEGTTCIWHIKGLEGLQ